MTETKTFAPDTNFFLQFKDPRELPWSELGNWSSVRLVILEAVLGELDKHKNGPNNRRTRKARKLHQKLRPLFTGEQEQLVLRESGPQVLLQLGPELPYDRERHPLLDPNHPDHRIIDEALASREQLDGLALLSDDGIATKKARGAGLEFFMPPDEWRLDPEPDDRDRRLREVERQIHALQTQAPLLTVALLQDDQEVDAFRGTIQRFHPTTDVFRSRALDAVRGKYPALDQRYLMGYVQHRKRWEEKIENRLAAHAKIAGLLKGLEKFSLSFENHGTVTAEGMEIEVELEGDLLLVDEDELVRLHGGQLAYPMPPNPPTYGAERHIRDLLAPDLHSFRRFPRELYWGVHAPKLGSKSAWGNCDDFRHQDAGVKRDLLLSGIRDQEACQASGQLIVRMSAKNLPEPVIQHFPIHIDFEWLEADEDARLQLAKDLGVHIPA